LRTGASGKKVSLEKVVEAIGKERFHCRFRMGAEVKKD
jgi:hypothetical protein